MAKQDLSDQAVGAAKQLAPWSTRIPWWVVLIEGIVVGGIGLYVVINPQGANVTLVIALSVALVIAGLMQFWSVMSNDVSEKIDSVVSARAAIAVYAGLLILVLYFLGDDPASGEQVLTRIAGYGIFGTAALIYGLLALIPVFRSDGSSRRQALIEFLLFTSVGLITLWGLYSGGESIVTAVTVIGWIFLICGIALIALAVWRWQKGDEADEVIDSVTGSVGGAADAVTSFGRSEDQDSPAQTDVADAVAKDSDKHEGQVQ